MEQQSRQEEAVSSSRETQQVQQRFIFQLLQKVGAEGTYQRVALIVWCICGFLASSLLLSAPFVFYQEPYVCPAQLTQNCQAYVCSLLPQQRSSYIPQLKMRSVISNYGDFRCSPQSNKVSLVMMIMYLGPIAAQLVLVLVGDLFGRKTLALKGFLALTAGCLIIILSINLIMAVAGLFLMMMGASLLYSLCFLFLCETVSQELRQKFTVCVQISFGVGQCANVGLYYWLGNWQPIFIYFYLIPILIGLVILTFFIVDTPMSLIKHYKLEQALDRFMWIGKVNGVQKCQLTIQHLQEAKQMENVRQQDQKANTKFTLLDLFKYSSLRYITIFIALMRLSVEFLYFVPNFMIAQFQLNVYINGIALGLSSLVGFIISYFIISKIKRKSFGLFSFTIVFICTLVLVFFWRPRGEGQELSLGTNIGVLVAVIIINLLISIEFSFFQIYTTQLFPSQVRVIAIGFIIVIGGVGVSTSDYTLSACKEHGVSVMVVFACLAFMGIIASLVLPETLKVPPPEIITELTTVRNISQRDKKTIRHHSSQEEQSRAQIMEQGNKVKKPSLQNIVLDTTLVDKPSQQVQPTQQVQEVGVIFVRPNPKTQSLDLENKDVKKLPKTQTTDLDNGRVKKQEEYQSDEIQQIIMKKASQETADVEYGLGRKSSQQNSQITEYHMKKSSQRSECSEARQEEQESKGTSEEEHSVQSVVSVPFQEKKDFNNVQVKKSEKKLEA